MSTAFPALTPSSRQITQGQYATKRFTSIAGTGTTRAYSTKPFNAELALQFENLTDAQALSVATAYDQARGSKDDLTLPDAFWAGMSEELKILIAGTYLWRFAEQPRLTSVRPGVTSISVRLSGQRDG